jgi:SAM-dependent methyltransferase
MKKKSKATITKYPEYERALQKYNGKLRLDIGGGSHPMEGCANMDVRYFPGVDFVHNLEKFPWPFPDESVSFVFGSHILEHINPTMPDPKLVGLIDLLLNKGVINHDEADKYIGEYKHLNTFIRFMDEVWRILEPGGRFIFVVPYAGSLGYWQDPTHVNPINEVTLAYFDPLDLSGFYRFYKPKPWKIVDNIWNSGGTLEVRLEKRLVDPDYGSEEFLNELKKRYENKPK